MDFCRNTPLPGGGHTSEFQPDQLLSPSTKLGSLDDLFSSHNMQEEDMGLEWLSIYVEDCFSSSGNCLPPAPVAPTNHDEPPKTATGGVLKASKESNPLVLKKTQQKYLTTCGSSLRKARSQRKRGGSSLTKSKTQFSNWSHFSPSPLLDQVSQDPPLLQQAYWLADSELILPKKDTESGSGGSGEEGGGKEEEEVVEEEGEEGMGSRGSLEGSNGQQPRRCTHCLSQRTPQWRAGPKGPKTLCNACGVRYKSGRLLPEYRPAKSPTFVSYKHSNSHRKVLEMRNMSLLLSSNS